jgi:hypothetical protein
MISFVKCPCCSGHEAIGLRTASVLADGIEAHLARFRNATDNATCIELENIANVIRNYEQRESPPVAADDDPLLA